MTAQEMAIAQLLGVALFITVVVIIIRFAVGKGVEDANRKTQKQTTALPRTAPAQNDDGPGRYEIKGVDHASKMDTTWVCQAESRANALVKGNLEGIEVTSARKL